MQTFIAELSEEELEVKPLRRPQQMLRLPVLLLIAYALAVGNYLGGFRPDILLQLTRPLYALEVVLLAAITFTSIIAAGISMYPDAYQHPGWLKLPNALLAALLMLILAQFAFLPSDPRMVVPEIANGMECTLCIAAVALLPSALLFRQLRTGASVTPLESGSFAVLASAGIGCLMLRLAEPNDSLYHLVTAHYLPTMLFAIIGAALGRWFLRW